VAGRQRGPKAKNPAPAPAGLWEGFDPPADLDAEARAEFARLTVALQQVGTAGRTDPRLVVAAARTHSLIEKAHAELAEGLGKLTQVAANGTLMPHPMIAVLNSLTMRLKALWHDLGLTPASAKLGSAPADEAENPWVGLAVGT
jgi:P27 family predicted phage terminase small subunit